MSGAMYTPDIRYSVQPAGLFPTFVLIIENDENTGNSASLD